MATNVYIGNLDPQTSSEEVRKALAGLDVNPEDVSLVRDPITGRRRGFGYLAFADERAAALAMERLEGLAIGERKLSVEPGAGQPPTRFVGER